MIVYLVTNLKNGKRYVGKTKRDLEKRWREHVTHSHGGSDEMALYRTIQKHGAESFELSVLEECVDEDALDEAEKRWIRELGTFRREYNMTEGGDGLKGYRHTAETRAKMSASRKGKKRSAEARANMSRAQKGHSVSDASREKMRQAKLGTKRSAEDRRKISEGQYVKVAQYDLVGNPIATYLSLKDAQMITGIQFQNISRACRFPHRTAGGFKWQYVDQKA